MFKLSEKENLVEELENSYRKYKTFIYYDNHSAIQRQRIAEFEYEHFYKNPDNDYFNENKKDSEENIFEKLAEEIIKGDIEKYLKKVEVLAFPKKMEKQESKIISNFNEITTDIKQIHYFIDLPIEAQILGVLWILRCGYVLDDKAYDFNCYGNRLNKTLLESLKTKEKSQFSPFLFEPYYKKYESWRDGALEKVKKIVDEDNDAIMISLDFKNYYYSSLIDFDALKEDLKQGRARIHGSKSENDINNTLTDFVKDVFTEYQSNFFENPKLTDKYPFIPLGFLPSLIIANWNLQGFDQTILEDVQPAYYGRYVDDILIVLKSHPKSESHGDHFFKDQTVESIIKKYFMKNDEDPSNEIFYFRKEEIKDECEKPRKSIKVHNLKNRNQDGVYFHYENLEIQEDKVKLYTFNHENSTTIIDNFKKKILQNTSEFKLMNDTDKLFSEFEDQLFKIDYAESINKLNNINKVRINKFEISKFMSGILDSLSYTGNLNKKAINDLIEAFENNIFDFFILWEKIFSILYVNKNYNELELLVETIDEQINELKFENPNETPYQAKEDYEKEAELVKNSLKRFLKNTLLRVISIKSDNNSRKIIEKLSETLDYGLNEFYLESSKLIFSSMINNRLMKYPIQDTSPIEKMIKENINRREKINYDLINENRGKKEIFDGFCYPRYIKFHEIILNENYNQIFRNSKGKDVRDYLNYLIEKHEEINFFNKYRLNNKDHDNHTTLKDYIKSGCQLSCIKSHECPINDKNNYNNDSKYETFKIGNENKTELTIGLISTRLYENDFKARLKGKPNLSIEKFNRINRLINDAIKSNVDLLIMPEMYIPPEWINEMAKTCKTNQIGMIFGLEPIIKDGEVYNYLMTILPFEYGSENSENRYFETMISTRLKNDYAPGEVQLIESNRLKIPKIDRKYYLYRWNGIHILPYVCYEIADIVYRSKFKSCCDIITVSEFNKDSNYFSNIAESLSRDSYCYCIKANASQYGGNCIIQPSKTVLKRIVDLKGGENDYLVIRKIDIGKIRNNAIKSDLIPSEKDKNLKPNPPGLNIDIIKERMGMESKYSKKHESEWTHIEEMKNKLLYNLYNRFEDLSDKTLSFWGLTFKPDVESSPAKLIIENFIKTNATLKIYTPEEKEKFETKNYKNVEYDFESKYDILDDCDALIILNKKEEFENYDICELNERMGEKIIFDTCDVISNDARNYDFEVHRIEFNE